MAKLAGRFYFRLTENRNLTGEFSNNISDRSQTESADRMLEDGDDQVYTEFDGHYHSVWYEPDLAEAILARLEISRKPGTHQIYTLRWIQRPSEIPLFEGEAMIGQELLIGNYWQAQP